MSGSSRPSLRERAGLGLRGVRGTAIAEGDGYTLLLYGGAAFGAADHIGLAISTDGVHFHTHPQNPVLTGEDIGLDEAGVHPVMAKLVRRAPSLVPRSHEAPSPECARGGIGRARRRSSISRTSWSAVVRREKQGSVPLLLAACGASELRTEQAGLRRTPRSTGVASYRQPSRVDAVSGDD